MPNFTKQTVRLSPNSEATGNQEIELTAWTEDAWNKFQNNLQEYKNNLEWELKHPLIASMKNNINKLADKIINSDDYQVLFGDKRIKKVQKSSHLSDWDMFSNIEEFLNTSIGGLLNRISPTQNIRLMYDAFNGKNISPLNYNSSWWNNSGIVSKKFALDHPYLTFGINGAADSLLLGGMAKGTKYLTEPIITSGSESPEVVTTRLSPYVIKHSTIEPSEMEIRNSIPTFLKTKYLGIDSNGLYVYKQPKVFIPKNPVRTFRSISNSLVNNHYFPFEHENMLGRGFLNILNNRVLSDFGETGYGLIGRTLFGKPVIIDMAVESIPEFMALMQKNGGKLNLK